MTRIDRLPPELEARLPAIRDEWIKIGLRTGPADREAARRAVGLAYRAAGLEPPKIVVWLDSPFAGAIGATMLAQVRDQVWAQVRDQVRDQVRAQVRDQVWDQVGAQVGDQVRDQVRAQVYRCGYGQHDASWLGFYAAFKGLVSEVDRLAGMTDLARAAGWWWPFQHAVILTERPIHLSRDDAGRLHREDGPALLYPDGFGVWAWRGLRVPQDVIEHPSAITVARIDAEQNAEQRRVLVERFGPARFIQESGAQLIHSDDWGSLYRRDMGDDEPLVMVKVVNSTPEPTGEFKDYWLRVHPELRPLLGLDGLGEPQKLTARNAVASTFGLRGEEYAPCVQT